MRVGSRRELGIESILVIGSQQSTVNTGFSFSLLMMMIVECGSSAFPSIDHHLNSHNTVFNTQGTLVLLPITVRDARYHCDLVPWTEIFVSNSNFQRLQAVLVLLMRNTTVLYLIYVVVLAIWYGTWSHTLTSHNKCSMMRMMMCRSSQYSTQLYCSL